MPYVTERWLGGTLTNFETITRRLERLAELERQESTGETGLLSKKDLSRFTREKRKLLRNLEGIRHMKRLPGAVVIIDPRREHIALKEAYKLGIPTICLIDTDSDPELVDIPIPGNDDAMRSIKVVIHQLVEGVLSGQKIARTAQGIEVKKLEEESAEAQPEKPLAAKRVIVRRVTGTGPAPAAPAPEAAGTPAEAAPAPDQAAPPAGEEG
jgi:small subunit ribosomal protein S2